MKGIEEISKEYRTLRKEVWERATLPEAGSLTTQSQNQAKLRGEIHHICNNADLGLYQVGPTLNKTDAAQKVWDHLWTKIRFAGIRSTLAGQEIASIAPIFSDYVAFCDEGWDYPGGARTQQYLRKEGEFANLSIVRNKVKLQKTVSLARKFCEFLTNANLEPIHFILGGSETANDWKTARDHLLEIGYRADITALHLMMDLGFQVVKPDIVLSRIFVEKGWLEGRIGGESLSPDDLVGKGRLKTKFLYTKKSCYEPVVDLAREISHNVNPEQLEADIGWVSANPIRELDIFVVKAGQIPDPAWGLVRTVFGVENS